MLLGAIWLVAVIAVWRWNITQPAMKVGQTISISMRVMDWPDSKYGKQIIRYGNWTIALPAGTTAKPGNLVRIVGKVGKKVIRGNNINYVLIASDFKILQENNFRHLCLKLIQKWLPGAEGVLVGGILLGGSLGMSEKTELAFRNVGLTHVVAASGYNVAVVAGWVMAVGWRLFGRKKAIPFVLFSIVLYMVLAGGSAAVVRAGLMAGAALVALCLGRPTDGGWWLAAVAGLMIIAKPGWATDIGFQLSVAAMAGLVWVEPKLKWGWAAMRTTIAAQITTLPLILHYFGNLSFVAPVANGLLLWMVPPMMQVSAIALGAGLVWEPAGRVLMLAVWPLAKLMTESVRWIGSQPWAATTIKPLGWGWAGLYYLTIILIFNFKYLIIKSAKKKKK